MAGIHAEASETEEDDEDEDDDIIDTGDTLRGNYERLKDYFQEIEKQKRKAFLE
jgi:hypothetical protein